ncbi:hypothetical protein FRX31_030115 [Thalictrum thalictroides]|uniref:Uncharacterized protein n=1 Tax=Thalictrum thalictroides TaxID=46969 RepID=A0A7J6V5M8_THATH|nr:hypothetical protein FRX31_030115 [Thalictrum thalictroides]
MMILDPKLMFNNSTWAEGVVMEFLINVEECGRVRGVVATGRVHVHLREEEFEISGVEPHKF